MTSAVREEIILCRDKFSALDKLIEIDSPEHIIVALFTTLKAELDRRYAELDESDFLYGVYGDLTKSVDNYDEIENSVFDVIGYCNYWLVKMS
ncbi:hypothetical protein ACP6H1_27470 [Vibrio harveyi]|uniref:hypothetical protein n=1 Tax=Vibrio harveyi TaxID=669 RepID=UPI003CF09F9A